MAIGWYSYHPFLNYEVPHLKIHFAFSCLIRHGTSTRPSDLESYQKMLSGDTYIIHLALSCLIMHGTGMRLSDLKSPQKMLSGNTHIIHFKI
jgi:hypothetical protein